MQKITPCVLLLMLSIISNAQNCLNASLENGTLEGYETYIGTINEDGTVSVDILNTSQSQHKLMNIGDGFDEIAARNCITNKELPVVSPNGGDYTLRLGNSNVGAQAERVVLNFKVTPELTFFQLRYAVILNDPNHEVFEQPRFELTIRDEQGGEFPCGKYKVRAAANNPGFESCANGWRVLPWTTVGFELQSFLNQNIQIELLTTDCALGKHAGYAYFDATCQPLTITLDGYCPGTVEATMRVTKGFIGYDWSTGETSSSITIKDPQPNEKYQVTVTSATGCTVVLEESIPDVTAFARPQFVSESEQTFCKDSTFLFTPKGENIRSIYSPTLDQSGPSFQVSTTSNSPYTFIAEGLDGCFADTMQLQLKKELFPVQTTIDSISCFGIADGAIHLSVDTDFKPMQYQWGHGATTPSIDQLSKGKYTVTITNAIQCTNTASIELKNPTPLYLQVVDRKPFICYGEADGQITVVPIGGSSPYEILWNTGEKNTTDLLQLSAGTYTVTLTDADGCTIENSAIIEEIPLPFIEAQVTPISCYAKEDGEINISISGRLPPYETHWQDNEQLNTPFRNNLPPGAYTALIKDNVGCTYDTSFVVPARTFDRDCGIYIPNAFSPNGDGVNDIFFVAGSEQGRSIESINIFDRWGELVFSMEDYCTTIGDQSCGWDGHFNGQRVPSGVYVYVIKVQVEGVSVPVWYSGELALVN